LIERYKGRFAQLREKTISVTEQKFLEIPAFFDEMLLSQSP
jgi:hypothetical protein